MKVVVDFDACESNARCMSLCPEVFEVGEEDDRLHLLVEHPVEELREKVMRAVNACPKGALSVLEDSGK